MPRLSVTILFLVCLTWAGWTSAANLSGRLELTGKTGRTSPEEAVVYFEPAQPVSVKPQEKTMVMATRGKAFQPAVLVVTRGSTVSFPNHDPILHNVFSVSPGNRFDLGFYRNGESKTWTFEKSGLVRVFCNVHYTMTAHIIVLDTPFFTSPDKDGNFLLEGLPAGAGKLRVWHDSARPFSQEIQVPGAEPPVIRLPVRRKRVVPHTNKFGKPYKRGGRNEYR